MAATIKDIAKKTGLGLATVSSYLNGGNVREKNRIKIEEAIEELHFEVNEMARGLKTNKTRTIGVVIPELNNLFSAEIISEIEDILRSHGYAVMICDCRTDKGLEAEAVEFLHRKRVDGLINIPVDNKGNHLKPFLKTQKPIVLIDRQINGVECDCVLVDNMAAAKEAAEALIAAGHEKIGMIAGPQDIFTARERLLGFCMALEDAGLKEYEKLITHGDYTIEGGRRCMEMLLRENPDMTAVFVSNYEMTMGAVIGMNERNIHIPGEISVIGFDNSEFARACRPRLSIVVQPAKAIAKQAAAIMLEHLEKSSERLPAQIIKLGTTFMKGDSVAERKGG